MAHETHPLPPYGTLRWRRLQAWRRRRLRKRFPAGQVSPHFNVDEFACKDRYRSAVPTRAAGGLERLCRDYLEPLRKRFGPCMVLSGYRPRPYNSAIGGAFHSQHIYDEGPADVAADLRFAEGSPEEWAAEAGRIAMRLHRGGVGLYVRSGFVHVDNRPYRASWTGN